MEIIKKVYKKISETLTLIGSIFVGIISILGFLFLAKKKSENDEKKSYNKIDELESKNQLAQQEIAKNSGKAEFIEEAQASLISQLNEENEDDSKNLEDFFDKRGF